MTTEVLNVHEGVRQFAVKWKPKNRTQVVDFLKDLRTVLNLYASAAIERGRMPETNVPDEWKREKADAPK